MGGHQHDLLIIVLQGLEALVIKCDVPFLGSQEGVDHRVARDHDVLAAEVLTAKVFLGLLGRREMEAGELANNFAVCFLRERGENIAGTQPRFEVNDLNPTCLLYTSPSPRD